MTERRGLVIAFLLCLAGSLVLLLSARGEWRRTETRTELGNGRYTVEVESARGGSGVTALGLVALAGTAALVASRGRGRAVVGTVLLAVGSAVVVAAGERVVNNGARSAALAGGAGGLAVAAAGALTVTRGRRWPTLSASYEPAATDRPEGLWDAQDQGDDPT